MFFLKWLNKSCIKRPRFYFYSMACLVTAAFAGYKAVSFFILAMPYLMGIVFTGAVTTAAILAGLLDVTTLKAIRFYEKKDTKILEKFEAFLDNSKNDFLLIAISFATSIIVIIIFYTDIPGIKCSPSFVSILLKDRALFFLSLEVLYLSFNSLLDLGISIFEFIKIKYSIS